MSFIGYIKFFGAVWSLTRIAPGKRPGDLMPFQCLAQGGGPPAAVGQSAITKFCERRYFPFFCCNAFEHGQHFTNIFYKCLIVVAALVDIKTDHIYPFISG